MTWISILIILALVAYLADRSHSSKRVSIFAQVVLILFMSYLAAFYGKHAQDHDNYVIRYNYFYGSKLSEAVGSLAIGKGSEGTEFGYYLLNVICNQIGLGELGFFLIIAIFVNTVCVKFIYERALPMLSFMFIFSMNFALLQANLIRQFIAMSIFLIFFKYLEQRNIKMFVIGLILMLLFHTSAFLFILLLPICFIKDSHVGFVKNILIGLWFISVLVAIGFVKVNFMSYVGMIEEYSKYTSSTNDVGTFVSIQRILFFNIFCIFSFISFYKKNIVLTSVFILSVVLMNFSNQYSNLARLYYYFSVFDYVFISVILSITSYENRLDYKRIRFLQPVMVCYCVMRLLSTYVIDGNAFEDTIPYDLSYLFR